MVLATARPDVSHGYKYDAPADNYQGATPDHTNNMFAVQQKTMYNTQSQYQDSQNFGMNGLGVSSAVQESSLPVNAYTMVQMPQNYPAPAAATMEYQTQVQLQQQQQQQPSQYTSSSSGYSSASSTHHQVQPQQTYTSTNSIGYPAATKQPMSYQAQPQPSYVSGSASYNTGNAFGSSAENVATGNVAMDMSNLGSANYQTGNTATYTTSTGSLGNMNTAQSGTSSFDLSGNSLGSQPTYDSSNNNNAASVSTDVSSNNNQQQNVYSSSVTSEQQQQQTYGTNTEDKLAPIITKSFYIHAAPEEPEENTGPKFVPVARPQKNYKIIFIKAPAYGVNSQIVPVAPQNEEKTIIYVLSKKPTINENIELPPVPTTEPTKPEVFFIKYKSDKEAHDTQQQIQGNF